MRLQNIFLLLAYLPVVLSGCATTVVTDQTSAEQREWLLSGEALEGVSANAVVLPDDDVLSMTDDMIRFVTEATEGSKTESGKIKALLGAMVDSDGRLFIHEPTATFTAAETFERGRANCLSFAGMMIVMLRHLGIQADFNEVDVPQIWDMRNQNTMVLYKHINVVIDPRSGRKQIADVNLAEYDSSYRQRVISDRLAVAQYYNNRAMAYFFEDTIIDAFRYLAKAISLEPDVSYLWANLGTLYRRTGNLRAAELSYRTAMLSDPTDLIAISNSARLYEILDRQDLAQELNRKADYFRSRNPYYRYRQGMNAFLNRDFEGAMDHTKAAIRIYPREHRFHFLLGAIYQKVGNERKAESSMRKAIEMSTDAKQSARYRSKMSRLLSSR